MEGKFSMELSSILFADLTSLPLLLLPFLFALSLRHSIFTFFAIHLSDPPVSELKNLFRARKETVRIEIEAQIAIMCSEIQAMIRNSRATSFAERQRKVK